MFLLILTGCENVDVVETGIEYSEKIVIQSELIAEEVWEGIHITRTLSPGEAYDIEKAAIKDALCYLKVNDHQIIPLHHTGDGLYKAIDDYVVRSGYTYELIGFSGDNSFYSVTKIPIAPEVIESSLDDDGYILCRTMVSKYEVYGCKWYVKNNNSDKIIYQADDFYSLVEPSEEDETALIRTSNIPDEYLADYYGDYIYFRAYAFDHQFLEYFHSRNNSNPVDDAFTQGGGLVNWNVQGNNVIGLFIGMAVRPLAKIRK